MKTLFESDRLLFREFALQDAEKMYELNADPEVLQFTGDEPFSSFESARTFLKDYRYDPNSALGRWLWSQKPPMNSSAGVV